MSGLEDDGSHPEATELSALIDGSQAEPRLPQDLKDEGVYPPFLFDTYLAQINAATTREFLRVEAER